MLAEPQAYLEMARESLQAARLESGADLHRNALASAYFAAHQAARGLLASRGIATKTHRGVVTLLREHFGAALPDGVEAWIVRLQGLRESSHYDWAFHPDDETVRTAIEQAERVVDAVRLLLE